VTILICERRLQCLHEYRAFFYATRLWLTQSWNRPPYFNYLNCQGAFVFWNRILCIPKSLAELKSPVVITRFKSLTAFLYESPESICSSIHEYLTLTYWLCNFSVWASLASSERNFNKMEFNMQMCVCRLWPELCKWLCSAWTREMRYNLQLLLLPDGFVHLQPWVGVSFFSDAWAHT